jgi:DNA polymerase-3 subunit gamma/tau
MLTTESFNALLKTLEEPPEHTIFIFATTDIHKVPPTIISRCQRFDFRRIELPAIKTLLSKIADAEKIEIDDQSLTLIAKKADGALRDAQSLFDQVISFGGNKIESSELSTMLNLIDEEIYFKISDSVLSKKFAAAFDVTKEVYDKGWNFLDFTNGLIEHFRNIMTVVIKKNTDLIDSAEVYKKIYLNYKDSFSEGDLLRILTFLNTVQYELKSSPNEKLKIEISLAHLIGLEKSGTISQLMESIENFDTSKLENLISMNEPGKITSSEKKKIELKVEPEPAGKPEIISQPDNIEITTEIIPENIDLDYIKAKWNDFIEAVKNEKLVGSHLVNSIPKQLDNGSLTIQLNDQEDFEIISSDYKNAECLKLVSNKLFGRKFNFSFVVENNDTDNDSDNSFEDDSPLIKAIKNELGGKEIKSH